MQFQEQAVTPCQLAFHSHGKVIFAASSYVPESNPRPCIKASEKPPFGEGIWGDLKPFISSQGSESTWKS